MFWYQTRCPGRVEPLITIIVTLLGEAGGGLRNAPLNVFGNALTVYCPSQQLTPLV